MPIVVLLGTGTGVGKTYVARELARALERASPGAWVSAVKPVESGHSLGAPSDSAALESTSRSGRKPTPHPLYAFQDAVSPHLAARRAHLEPANVGRIREWVERFYAELASTTTGEIWLIVETAGGAFSPLAEDATSADLALALEPCFWVLVAPDALGVLHDVTTTLFTLQGRARAPDALVLSASREADASTGTNAEELRRLGIIEPAAVLERDGSDLGALARSLVQRAKS